MAYLTLTYGRGQMPPLCGALLSNKAEFFDLSEWFVAGQRICFQWREEEDYLQELYFVGNPESDGPRKWEGEQHCCSSKLARNGHSMKLHVAVKARLTRTHFG